MCTVLPQLPIAEYAVTYQALNELTIPAFSVDLWHSVFGRAPRELVCVAPATRCEACLLLHNCDYSFLFSGPRPPQAEIMRQYDTIPVPHVFRFDNLPDLTVLTGQRFSVRLVLVGNANQRLPVVIRALYGAGMAGLGKARQKAGLDEVIQAAPGTVPRLIMEEARICNEANAQALATPESPDNIRIQLLMPYLPSRKAKPSGQLDVSRFLMGIIRSISLLQYFYTGKKLDADFKQLKGITEQARVVDARLFWQPNKRDSATHEHRIDTSGLIGYFNPCLSGYRTIQLPVVLAPWICRPGDTSYRRIVQHPDRHASIYSWRISAPYGRMCILGNGCM